MPLIVEHFLTHARPQNKEGHLLEERGFGILPAASHAKPPPGSQLPRICTQGNNIPHRTLRVPRLPYRRSRRRYGSPRVGPLNMSLKRLKLPTVTPGATSTLSASSASLFLCRFSDVFPHDHKSSTPPSHTVMYRTLGCPALAASRPWWTQTVEVRGR